MSAIKGIEKYEVVDLGEHHTDFFQGFGIFGTDYDFAIYGIGFNCNEALEDCLEMLSQSVTNIDIEQLEADIKKRYASYYEPKYIAYTEVERESAEDCDLSVYYHVGIRVKLNEKPYPHLRELMSMMQVSGAAAPEDSSFVARFDNGELQWPDSVDELEATAAGIPESLREIVATGADGEGETWPFDLLVMVNPKVAELGEFLNSAYEGVSLADYRKQKDTGDANV